MNLRGRLLGVWGYGRIGQVVAGYGKAFGMRVWVWGSADSRKRAVADGHQAADNVDAFFSQSDVVSLHLRLNDSTRAIVTAHELALMKPSAVLVNTSRAGLIAPGALHQALLAGRPGMAAIDVFDSEPVTDVHDPLLQRPTWWPRPTSATLKWTAWKTSSMKYSSRFCGGRPVGRCMWSTRRCWHKASRPSPKAR